MAKANRASLLRLALRLSRCESMSPYAFDGSKATLRHRGDGIGQGALQPHRIPEHIPPRSGGGW